MNPTGLRKIRSWRGRASRRRASQPCAARSVAAGRPLRTTVMLVRRLVRAHTTGRRRLPLGHTRGARWESSAKAQEAPQKKVPDAIPGSWCRPPAPTHPPPDQSASSFFVGCLQVAASRAAGRSLNCHTARAGPRGAAVRPGVAGAAAGAATVQPRVSRRTPGAARLDEDTAVLHGTSSRLLARRGTPDARGLHTPLPVPF